MFCPRMAKRGFPTEMACLASCLRGGTSNCGPRSTGHVSSIRTTVAQALRCGRIIGHSADGCPSVSAYASQSHRPKLKFQHGHVQAGYKILFRFRKGLRYHLDCSCTSALFLLPRLVYHTKAGRTTPHSLFSSLSFILPFPIEALIDSLQAKPIQCSKQHARPRAHVAGNRRPMSCPIYLQSGFVVAKPSPS